MNTCASFLCHAEALKNQETKNRKHKRKQQTFIRKQDIFVYDFIPSAQMTGNLTDFRFSELCMNYAVFARVYVFVYRQVKVDDPPRSIRMGPHILMFQLQYRSISM